MTYTRLHAGTGRGTRDILRSVLGEINAELLRRHPGDRDAQHEALSLPLRMTIHLDVDADHVPARILTAETARGAKDILNSALEHLKAEQLRTSPGDPDGQHQWSYNPLETWIHFDLDDLDREGPLSVEDCLHMPYDGIPKGLQPSADRRPPRWVVVRAVPTGRRNLLQRVMGR
ncbi:hypothetical protein [Streptomyces sp. t99]|uniref:hypothetical protein n=1 Tax=Streptomyces sp. t99 TaxID=1828172 RepID=UPI000BFBF454|nr:hypothetical protein [Streptomyces sp. t99]